MQAFQLTSKMISMGGVFYPTGYAVVLFPDAEHVSKAGKELEAAGFASEDIMELTPPVILREIGQVKGDEAVALPSVGTEGATVQKYINLAREGHHGLMIKASSDDDSERMMAVVRKFPFSYGQKYHMLAIEDLE